MLEILPRRRSGARDCTYVLVKAMKVAWDAPIPALASIARGMVFDSARRMMVTPLNIPVQMRSCPFTFSLRTPAIESIPTREPAPKAITR